MTSPDKRSEINACTELINQATKCLENLNKQCTIRLIEELIRNGCYRIKTSGTDVAIKNLVHNVWLVLNYVEEGELLRRLRDLGVSITWLSMALLKPKSQIKHLLRRYGLG
jgi:hypothetical protein